MNEKRNELESVLFKAKAISETTSEALCNKSNVDYVALTDATLDYINQAIDILDNSEAAGNEK